MKKSEVGLIITGFVSLVLSLIMAVVTLVVFIGALSMEYKDSELRQKIENGVEISELIDSTFGG